ncbi:MAG: glycosyltransferase [Deltaproteobacteria bacterium]|nr:glycosyltransferase [Deltaproteobacteria bacterium]
MANIFLNGLKSKTGGGKSILNNYLGLLHESKSKDRYFILTPNKNEYEKYSSDFIEIIDIDNLYKKQLLFPFVNHFVLPKLLKQLKIDALFNIGDIVIPTKLPQVYLFDWPYAAYPESIVWKRMDMQSYLNRMIKMYFFKKYIREATTVIAQTRTMKEKLQSLYDLKNIEIIPNAVSLENVGGGEPFDFNLPMEKTKLLYLTYYYSHKNIEVFLPLAKKIKALNLPYCIVVTIAPEQHKRAKTFLNTVKKESLDETIVNVGPVAMMRVPSLYAQTDALLMPTLLESFSGTYVEAMFHQKIILTSDLDFAKDVCGGAALYFDPVNSDSILDTVNVAFDGDAMRKSKIDEGKNRLSQMLTWKQAFDKYQNLLEKAVADI